MQNHPAPSSHSTAKTPATATTFKPRVRRLGEGRYLVESATKPGTGHPVTASSCNCPGFTYRGTCRHVALVRALEPSMTAWYDQAAPPSVPVSVPMTGGAPSGIKRPVMIAPPAITSLDAQADAAEARLAQAYRALADAHEQSDERAVLLRRVGELERAVAAANYSAMRQAA